MRGIDDARENPLHEVMSRPFRPLLPAVLVALSVSFSACVGTIYDRTYSNRKNYFKKPVEKKEVSAEAILGAVDANTPPANPDAAAAGALQPGADIPGLPPAGMPAVPGLDALPPPAAPPAVPPPN